MTLISANNLTELTDDLLQQYSTMSTQKVISQFDELWSVVQQELLRYSMTMATPCETTLRTLVGNGMMTLGESAQVQAPPSPPGAVPQVVMAPYVHLRLGAPQPVRYLIYGIQMHKNPHEELAELALRTLTLTMIKIAKENEADELTIQTFNSAKSVLCPLWPFWDREDC